MQGDSSTQVQLEDEHDDAGGARSRPTPRPTHRRWWPVAALGLVVVAAAAYAVGDERRRTADLARHAEVHGVVGSLAEPLEEAWRADVRGDAVNQLADVLLVSETAAEGPSALRALDLATGRERWRLDGPPGAWPVQCLGELAGTDGPLALCAVTLTADQPVGEAVADLYLVDVASGEAEPPGVLGGRPWRWTPVNEVDGDLLLVIEDEPGAPAVINRYDPEQGATVWSVPLPDGVGLGLTTRMGAIGDVVVVSDADTTALLDGDGRELRTLNRPASPGRAPAQLPLAGSAEHGVGIWQEPDVGAWFSPEGKRTAELRGRPVELDVLGAAEPPVLVLRRDGALVGVDVRTGAELWDRPVEGRSRVVLDGRLVLSTRDRLEAVDVETGETLWQVELGPTLDGATAPTITDGVRIALPGERDGRTTMTAFDLASGRVVWESLLPAGTSRVERLGSAVFAWAPDRRTQELVLLR
ncbi:hypothetical protein N866_18625 [Actinotalea ferrariae CF5-4]|uniref:Pyrrolo-quinoline quinone repeat domain-containing protein n=1 Tax=Actinotalea ferrariae CF5-4 TaxID=948458 RepID=A0A021VRG4_9CELL|nr:PQQ-binding-like beta-propeller repeat protein [Actinotalea ferrariae]EYR63726.1 hypothetical protein N866_18625 [Actinotalea ferrariae CF5-4]